jgi:hypothetical protein
MVTDDEPVLVIVAVTVTMPPAATVAGVAVFATEMLELITVVVACAVAVTVAPVWSVPVAVTVSVTVPGVAGAAYEPVHVVDAPAAKVVDPQVRAPA